jgi:hypothetical protein
MSRVGVALCWSTGLIGEPMLTLQSGLLAASAEASRAARIRCRCRQTLLEWFAYGRHPGHVARVLLTGRPPGQGADGV